MADRNKGCRGFTLIETLVALLILSLSLGAIFTIFSDSMRAVQLGADRAHALALAQSRMAMVDAGDMSGIGVTSGEDDTGFRWQTEVREMPDPPLASPDSGLMPVEVVVTVSWGIARQREINLTTLRLLQP